MTAWRNLVVLNDNNVKQLFFILSVLVTLGVNGQIPTERLVLYQTFNNHLKDVWGKKPTTGINTSLTTDRVNRPNSACHFGGNSVLIDSLPSQGYDNNSACSFWFRTSSNGKMCLMNQGFLMVSIQNGFLSLNDSIQMDLTKYNDNKYHHVLMTKSTIGIVVGGKIFYNMAYRLSVDTIFQTKLIYNISEKQTDSLNRFGLIEGEFYFGSSSNNTFKFTGDMDDILLYSFPFASSGFPMVSQIFNYKPPVFTDFTYYPDSVPNFTIKGNYLTGVTNVVFMGGKENPVTLVSDEVIKTNVPMGFQNGSVILVKGFDTTYSPIPFNGFPTGLNEVYGGNQVKIYPNPSNGVINVSGEGKVEVFDLTGQSVRKQEVKGEARLDLNPGVYFIRIGNRVERVIINQ